MFGRICWRNGMQGSEVKPGERVKNVYFTEDTLAVDPMDGRTIVVPLVLWVCMGRVFRVEDGDSVPLDELLLRIKHAALQEEKKLHRMQREVQAYETQRLGGRR
jgi:hypothetical protein